MGSRNCLAICTHFYGIDDYIDAGRHSRCCSKGRSDIISHTSIQSMQQAHPLSSQLVESRFLPLSVRSIRAAERFGPGFSRRGSPSRAMTIEKSGGKRHEARGCAARRGAAPHALSWTPRRERMPARQYENDEAKNEVSCLAAISQPRGALSSAWSPHLHSESPRVQTRSWKWVFLSNLRLSTDLPAKQAATHGEDSVRLVDRSRLG